MTDTPTTSNPFEQLPDVDTHILKAAPGVYGPTISAENAAAAERSLVTSGNVAAASILTMREFAKTLEQVHPEFKTQVHIPTYHDLENVYDALTGEQLFNVDGTPKKWMRMGLKVGSHPKDDDSPAIVNLEGKVLTPVNIGAQRASVVGKLNEMLFNISDGRMNFMTIEADMNMHWKDIVDKTKNAGPDWKYRIIFSEKNPVTGELQDYKGKPLTEQEVISYYRQIKENANPYYLLACAAYEFTKREEELRVGEEGSWIKILNVLHQQFALDPTIILGAVHQGLIFGRKTEDLTTKHTPIEYVTREGEVIDPRKLSKRQWDKHRREGSAIRFGALNELAFVEEFATKHSAPDRRYGSGDIATMIRLTKEVERRLDRAGDEDFHIKNRRNWQFAALLGGRLNVLAKSARQSTSTPNSDDPLDIARALTPKGPVGPQQYEPSLYGAGALANEAWVKLIKLIENVAAEHPEITVIDTLGEHKNAGTIRQDNRP